MANVTNLLIRWTAGDTASGGDLFEAVQQELRQIAERYMRHERSGHTLQTTALVNEAYLRLVDATKIDWQNRAHFYAIAARVMRQILVDYARRSHRERRGGDFQHIPFDEALVFTPSKSAQLIALDEALVRLAEKDARKAAVVELRYFGGLDVQETAAALGVHVNTVIRDWSLAKAWLKREMEPGATA